MPACFAPRIRALSAAALALALVACGPDDPGHLAVTSATLVTGPEPMLEVTLDHDFGPTLLEALHSGVALRYAWTVQLQGEPAALGRPVLGEDQGALEITYRSLTRWYTLSGISADGPLALPTIGDAEAQLRSLSLRLDGPLPDGVRAGRFRIALDHRALPPPLRLPAYLSGTWRRDSGWVRLAPNEPPAAAIMAP